MTIKAAAPIDFPDLRAEFGGTTANDLGDYRSGGALVPAGTFSDVGLIPSAGDISLGDFYGAALGFPFTMVAGDSGAQSGFSDGVIGSIVPTTYLGVGWRELAYHTDTNVLHVRLGGAQVQSFWNRITIVGPGWEDEFLASAAVFSTPGFDSLWEITTNRGAFTTGQDYLINLIENP